MKMRAKLWPALLAGALLWSAGQAAADDIVRIASGYQTTTLDPARSAAGGQHRDLRATLRASAAPRCRWYAAAGPGRIVENIRRRKDGHLDPAGREILRRQPDHRRRRGVQPACASAIFQTPPTPAPLQQMADAKAVDPKTVVITLKTVFAPVPRQSRGLQYRASSRRPMSRSAARRKPSPARPSPPAPTWSRNGSRVTA